MMPQWTNNLKDTEEVKRFKSYLWNSKGVLDRQFEILCDEERALDNKETDADQYESPSWAARQADINGYRRCLRKMKSLITLDLKDKPIT